MALWGITDADESKPKWLSDDNKVADKQNCFATNEGWVLRHYKNSDKTEWWDEVLVSISNLASSTGVNIADITDVEFYTSSFSEADGGNIDIIVYWNEKVTVDTSGGTPTITVTNDQTGSGTDATFTAAYQRGTGTNRIVFRKTYGAADGGVAENDVLSIGAQSVALNSGTIVDSNDGTTNSALVITAAQGTAAGTLTASA